MSSIKKNQMYLIENADKLKNESWCDPGHSDDCLNFPCPSRILIIGAPNSGKTNTIKNLLIHMSPRIDNIFIIHPECYEPELALADENDMNKVVNLKVRNIDEYAGVVAVYLRTIPPIEWWAQFSGKKNVLIIDDIDLKSYQAKSCARKEKINKLYSYVSTHRKLTIITGFQDVFSQGVPAIYRFSNVFIIYQMKDKNLCNYIARICGVENKFIHAMMQLCRSSHDSITIDTTNDSPMMYRYNLVKKIIGPESDSESDSDGSA